MAKAKKLPSGSWRVNAYIGRDENGKQIRKSFTADTKKAAELAAAQYVIREHHEADPQNLSVERAIEQYIESKSNILSPATIRLYHSTLKALPTGFVRLPVSTLTNTDIQKAIDQYSVGRSPKTVANAHGLITVSLSQIMPERVFRVSLPQKKKTEIHIPSTIEINLLMSRFANTPYEVPVALAAYMGLRRSEIIALEWKDIDFTRGTLSVNKAKVLGEDKQLHEKPTKTTAGTRVLTMPDTVKDILSRQDKTEPVCQLSYNTLSNFRTTVAKIEGVRPFNFHALRHYYASVLLSLNVPNKYAQERMGHATDNMLKNVYQHLMEDKQKEVDALINGFFGGSKP